MIDLTNDLHTQDNANLFACIADNLANNGYSVNPNALPLTLANQLRLHVSAMADESFVQAAIGRHQNHARNNLVRSQKLCWISSDSPANSAWLTWAGELQRYLNEHLFLGLSSFESHYAHYGPGDFYKRHYDAFKGQSSRRLSIIAYLNQDWLADDGGKLVLYTGDDDETGLTVSPDFATVVVFLSAEHPHEVLPAKRDRYSIAGWYSPTN